MAREKLTMSKPDVEMAISNHVKQKYHELNVIGRSRPSNIQRVSATIQDREYIGAGKYNVLLDIYGMEDDDNSGFRENIHYTTLCSISVAPDSEGTPVPVLNESLILTKQIL